jgi:hypothetical protein
MAMVFAVKPVVATHAATVEKNAPPGGSHAPKNGKTEAATPVAGGTEPDGEGVFRFQAAYSMPMPPHITDTPATEILPASSCNQFDPR